MPENNSLTTPILNTLNEYLLKKPVRMHVPFHSGIPNNNVLPEELYKLDISEVSGYDIEGEDNPIYQSEKITANFFGVEHSFYLTGGASVGLLAALIALKKHGEKVLLLRNVHKSIINGVILAELEPVWVEVDFLSEWGIFSKVNLESLKESIKNNSNISGCVIVSPTYEGVISNVCEISDICHENNIPLIVDEAHGAHLFFLNEKNLKSAIQSKADIVIQSWHKSLGALTQSGVLHLTQNQFFTYNDIKRSLDLVSSTSPSFLLLLSLELTRKHLVQTQGTYFNGLYFNSVHCKNELNKIDGIECFQNEDPFKIYLKSKSFSGIDFAYSLYKDYSIEIESANNIGLLMLTGVSFNEEVMKNVIGAIKEISVSRDMPRHVSVDNLAEPTTNKFKKTPREAFFSGFKNKSVDYEYEVNAPCPPGYVLKIPGTKK